MPRRRGLRPRLLATVVRSNATSPWPARGEMSRYPPSSRFFSRQLGGQTGTPFMVRAICEPGGFASRTRGTLPNKALQRTALRAAAELER